MAATADGNQAFVCDLLLQVQGRGVGGEADRQGVRYCQQQVNNNAECGKDDK